LVNKTAALLCRQSRKRQSRRAGSTAFTPRALYLLSEAKAGAVEKPRQLDTLFSIAPGSQRRLCNGPSHPLAERNLVIEQAHC
jgi:hypothetical protein